MAMLLISRGSWDEIGLFASIGRPSTTVGKNRSTAPLLETVNTLRQGRLSCSRSLLRTWPHLGNGFPTPAEKNGGAMEHVTAVRPTVTPRFFPPSTSSRTVVCLNTIGSRPAISVGNLGFVPPRHCERQSTY